MLAPLDERMLRSLVEYDEEVEYEAHSDPRKAFTENWISAGLQFIFDRFQFFWAVLDTPGAIAGDEWPDPPYWAIKFRERPWKHLSIRPDPTDKTSCRVFEDSKHIKSYKMLGCPDQWVDLVRWLWNYGNDRAMKLKAIDARRARKHCANPVFSLPARRRNSRSKHKSSPSGAHPTSHVLQRTGLRPHQGVKSRGKQRASPLSTMTLAGIEEDARAEGQVSDEVVPEDCDIAPASDAKMQRASEDSSKLSTVETMELGLADTHETQEDEVG